MFETFKGSNDEGAVGPGARKGGVEVEGGGVEMFWVGVTELGSGSGVGSGWVRWGELGHHEKPDGGPGGTDGGD